MRRIGNPLFLLIAGVVLLAMSGCAGDGDGVNTGEISYHYVDVYLTEGRDFVAYIGGTPITEILVYPKDFLIINNPTDKKFEIELPAGVFEEIGAVKKFDNLKGTLAAHKRAVFKVIAEAPAEVFFKINIEGDGTVGEPKVKVGEEP